MSVAIVEAALRLDAKQFTKTINEAKNSIAKFSTDSKAIAAGAGAGLLATSAGLGALAKNLFDAASGADEIGDSLASAFKGGQLDAVTKQVLELGAEAGGLEKQFAAAAKSVAKFGKDPLTALQALADVGAKTGVEVSALAEAYGKFGRDDKSTKALLKLTGIKPGDLVQFGAVLDSTGTKLDLAGDGARKANDAFLALAKSDKFSGAFAAGQDGASHLTAELKLLKQEIGAGLVSAFEDAGSAILPLVQYFRGFSDESKKFIGIGLAVGAAATGIVGLGLVVGAAAAQIVTAVAAMGGFAVVGASIATAAGTAGAAISGGLTVAMGGLLAIATPLVITVGTLATGLAVYTNAIEDATVAAEELFAIEEKRADSARTAEQFIGQSAQQLAAAGKTAKDVAAVADGLRDKAEAANNAGNTELLNKLKAQVGELNLVKAELATLEADARDQQQVRDEVQSALGTETKAEVDAKTKAEDAYLSERKAAEDAAAKATTAKELAEHNKRLKAKQDALNAGAKIVVKVDYDQATSAGVLTQKLKDEQSKRLKDQTDAAATALAAAKQQADDLADAQGVGRGLKGGALARKADDLQQSTEATGVDNSAAITATFKEKLALDLESIRLEADKAKAATDSAEARVQIEANAQAQIAEAYATTADELDDSLARQLDAVKRFEADKKSAQGSMLGGTFGIEDLAAQSSLGFGVGRDRGSAAPGSSLPGLQLAVKPDASAVGNDPAFDKLTSAADLFTAAVAKFSAATDKPVKVAVTTNGNGSNPSRTTGVNGNMGDLEKSGRGQRAPVAAR